MHELIKILIDGLVYENDYQIGIRRSFYEVMTRLSGRRLYPVAEEQAGPATSAQCPPRLRFGQTADFSI